MTVSRFFVTGASALSLLASATCIAEDINKQSAASRHASKARDYADRQDREAPADRATTSSIGSVDSKEIDKMPVLDSPVVEKAAKDTGDNWKRLDKVLDRF